MEQNIINLLTLIKKDLSNGQIASGGELAKRLQSAVELSNSRVSLPRFFPGEPPSSAKMNKMIDELERSLSDREYIFDILLAASIYDYNSAMSILDDLMDRVMGIQDTVKTLTFYSQPAPANVHIISTDFRQGWGIFKNSSKQLTRSFGAGLTLPVVKREIAKGEFKITGGGMGGSWYLLDSSGALVADSVKCDDQEYAFDGKSTSHFEYQRYRVGQSILNSTGGYGFGFSDTEFKWASKDYNDISMNIAITLDAPRTVNYGIIVPSDGAAEFVIESIVLSLGGVTGKTLTPVNLNVNQELFMLSEPGYCNYAVYSFEPTLCDGINLKLKSTKPTACLVKHAYELDSDGKRIAGDSPPIGEPHSKLSEFTTESDTEKLESLSADRFFIGVKDIIFESMVYEKSGTITSEAVMFSKPIDRIALRTDSITNENCSAYYSVSIDDGKTWYAINPLGESITNQVLAVNDLVPDSYRDASTKYISAPGTPSSVMLRVSMERLTGSAEFTSVLRTLEMEVTLKS